MEERRRQACNEIDEIRIDAGGITPDDLQYLKRERGDLLRTFRSLQKQVATSAKILAEQLNTKDTRFIYELIQNADDNHYPNGEEPFLKFTLQEECLKIESNEVGFTRENIAAISRIGHSTKGSKVGFIGEKGIGFKSVFRVARKVHIQSEPYSFAFIHDDEDSGLGMVTPLNEPFLDVQDGVQTQMILYFRDASNREEVLQEFLYKLPLTVLLFLKKLKRLTIDINIPTNAKSRHISYSMLPAVCPPNKNIVTLRKGDGKSFSDHDFWLKKQQVYNMPVNAARASISQAEVVLAFPLLEEVPVLENQWVSAFLPMKKEGFKFLIQSDFITGANREEVQQCEWNDHLRTAVSNAFVNAAREKNGFLSHPTLRYSWVRYIPTHDRGQDTYWGTLQNSIVRKLKTQRLFFSQQQDCTEYNQAVDDNEVEWWQPEQLRIVTQEYRNEEQEPLLQDLIQGKTAYISEQYDQVLDLPILRHLGTLDLRLIPDFVDRMSQDLDRDDSKWRCLEFSSPWRTAIAHLLRKLIKNSAQKILIQRMEMVPLQTSRWVRSLNASLFFPTCGGIDIPNGLGLNLINASALENRTLEALLMDLGVSQCKPEQVISLIEQRYLAGGSIPEDVVIQDIEFLFWHNAKVPTKGYKIYLACDEGGEYRASSVATGSWLYCPDSDHPYSMFTLLDCKVPTDLNNVIRVPSTKYFEALEKRGTRNGSSGRDWLMSRAGITITPRLCRRNNMTMSTELKYICAHLPHHLVGVLRHDWTSYVKSSDWDAVIRSIEVPILDTQKARALETTYLPLPSLTTIAAEMNLSQGFGFLAELAPMSEVEAVEWSFLERFGVGIKEDLNFWLALLRRLKQNEGNVELTHLFRIYRQLQKFTSNEEIEILRQAFDTEELLYIPTPKSLDAWRWVPLWFCIWKAPNWFLSKMALERLDDYKPLYGLFVHTLQVRDLAILDCLTMLEEIRHECYDDVDDQENNTYRLYSKLNELVEAEEDRNAAMEQIREHFEDDHLVFDKAKKLWHAPTSCIWAEDHIQLPGKVSLASAYKNYAKFFLQILKIPKPNLAMHIASLIEKSSGSPVKETIFQEMLNICALDPNPAILQAKLLDCRCFPMRNPSGQIEWVEFTQKFAIVDRAEYGSMFRDKINTLDFTLEEVHSVKVLIFGLKLEKRYLSIAVTEETEVEEAIADPPLTADLRSKAYAITRYSAHLGAPEPLKIFSMLEHLEVFTSDRIFRTVSVFQAQQKDNAFFHIEKIGTQLNMYVPRNQEQQQVCLFRQLPLKLLVQLGVPVQGKGTELSAIITASSLVVVDTILEQDGVIEIVGIRKPENPMLRPPLVPAMSTNSAAAYMGSLSTPEDSDYMISAFYSSSRPEVTYRDDNTSRVSNGASWKPAVGDSHAPHETVEEHPELFQKLIDFAVHQANHTNGLPNLGSNVKALQAYEEPFDHGLAVQCSRVTDRIGAVGELFVYTVLQNLALTNFDESCWKSEIRHLIAVNNQYSGIFTKLPSKGATDIVYDDKKAELTDLLIQSGYLASNLWRGCTPKYYIEVKATMGRMEHPFFCSQAQFDRMESMELSDDDEVADEVYLIARVFGMGKDRMGMKFYLDPWKLRRAKELRFFTRDYQVTPL